MVSFSRLVAGISHETLASSHTDNRVAVACGFCQPDCGLIAIQCQPRLLADLVGTVGVTCQPAACYLVVGMPYILRVCSLESIWAA